MFQVIPEVSYDEIQAGPSAKVLNDLKKRGAFVVRNVVPSETVSDGALQTQLPTTDT